MFLRTVGKSQEIWLKLEESQEKLGIIVSHADDYYPCIICTTIWSGQVLFISNM